MVPVSPRHQEPLPICQMKVHKICPLPVKSFTGQKEILDKMCQYFDNGHDDQHVFVLHGLGGSGKSQLAFKFLDNSKTDCRYDSFKNLRACSAAVLPRFFKNLIPKTSIMRFCDFVAMLTCCHLGAQQRATALVQSIPKMSKT